MEPSPYILPPLPVDLTLLSDGSITGGAAPTFEKPWLEGLIEHFSPSSIRMLKICPEQYRQRYILGRKERPSDRFTLGTAVHGAVGHSFKQKVESHVDLKLPEVVEYFHDEAWPLALEKDGGADNIHWNDKADDVRRDGERMTMAYHASVAPRIQPVEPPEQKVSLWVEGMPVPVIGYVDVTEDANVVDLKTGKAVQRKPDGHWWTQGTLYALAKQKPVHFHSLSRAKTPSIATPLTDPEMVVPYREDLADTTRQLLLDYVYRLEDIMARYGPDEPWPQEGRFMDYKGGPACNYCGFRKFCPAWAWERRAA